MFAIIKTGGKQIFVKKDDVIFIEKLEGEKGDKIFFNDVLATNKQIGKPFIPNISVEGIIEKQDKQKKIVVYRHNKKSTHKKKKGHRQPYTRVKIINLNNEVKI